MSLLKPSFDGSQLSLRDGLSEPGLQRWLTALSIPDAPLRRQGLRTALQYFQMRMPSLPAPDALLLMGAMDLSKPVRALDLKPGDVLIGARTPVESPFKLFFTRAGRAMHQSGINTHDRRTVRFEVHTPCTVLESHTTGTLDGWTAASPAQQRYSSPRAQTLGVMVLGGNVQLIVPHSARYLRVTQDNGPRLSRPGLR